MRLKMLTLNNIPAAICMKENAEKYKKCIKLTPCIHDEKARQQNLMSHITRLPTASLSRCTYCRRIMLRSARKAGFDSATYSV